MKSELMNDIVFYWYMVIVFVISDYESNNIVKEINRLKSIVHEDWV